MYDMPDDGFNDNYLVEDAGLDHVAIALIWSMLAHKVPAAPVGRKLKTHFLLRSTETFSCDQC